VYSGFDFDCLRRNNTWCQKWDSNPSLHSEAMQKDNTEFCKIFPGRASGPPYNGRPKVDL